MERRFKLIDDYPGHTYVGETGTTAKDNVDGVVWYHDSAYFERWSKFWEEIFPVAFKRNTFGIFRLKDERYEPDNPIYSGYDTKVFLECPTSIQELYWHESDIPEERTPLKTTEDGVDLFEGDDYWAVDKYNPTHTWLRKAKKDHFLSDFAIARFSTKQAAQSYIDEHSKKYSIADVERAFNIACNPFLDDVVLIGMIEKLKEGAE